MTRQEFLDNIEDFSDLLNFCSEYGLYTMEDVIDNVSECVSEDLREYAYEFSWTEIRDWLNGIEDGGSWYRRDGCFDYCCIDDCFDEWKGYVLQDADEDGVFDDEEEEEEEDEPEEEEGLFFVPSDVWLPCAGEIQDAAFRYREAAQQADAAIRTGDLAGLYANP